MINRRWIKRTLVALSLAGAVAGGAVVAAWAASVTVSSASLGGGTATVAACQTTGTISATYTTSDTGTGYKITGVTLTGVDAQHCSGQTISITVGDGANSLGTGSTTVNSAASTYAIPLAPTPLESAVSQLDIEIK